MKRPDGNAVAFKAHGITMITFDKHNPAAATYPCNP